MKTAKQLRRDIESSLQELLERYREKDSLSQAEETHGEELDSDFIANKIEELESVIESVSDVLDDLSYIQ